MLTLVGDAFPRRVGLSLLTQVGLSAEAQSLLLACSAREFEDLGVRIATSGVLRVLRRHLIEATPTAPLFDTMRFTGNMERAHMAMWDAHVAGEHEARMAGVPAASRAVRHLAIGAHDPG